MAIPTNKAVKSREDPTTLTEPKEKDRATAVGLAALELLERLIWTQETKATIVLATYQGHLAIQEGPVSTDDMTVALVICPSSQATLRNLRFLTAHMRPVRSKEDVKIILAHCLDPLAIHKSLICARTEIQRVLVCTAKNPQEVPNMIKMGNLCAGSRIHIMAMRAEPQAATDVLLLKKTTAATFNWMGAQVFLVSPVKWSGLVAWRLQADP